MAYDNISIYIIICPIMVYNIETLCTKNLLYKLFYCKTEVNYIIIFVESLYLTFPNHLLVIVDGSCGAGYVVHSGPDNDGRLLTDAARLAHRSLQFP